MKIRVIINDESGRVWIEGSGAMRAKDYFVPTEKCIDHVGPKIAGEFDDYKKAQALTIEINKKGVAEWSENHFKPKPKRKPKKKAEPVTDPIESIEEINN